MPRNWKTTSFALGKQRDAGLCLLAGTTHAERNVPASAARTVQSHGD